MHTSTSFIVALILLIAVSCKEKTMSREEEILGYINNYDSAAMQKVIAPDFVMQQRYVNHEWGREEFFKEFLNGSVGLKAKFIVLKKMNEAPPYQYLVKDQSIFFDHLKIGEPEWLLTFVLDKDQKLTRIISDSTEGFHLYQKEVRSKIDSFSTWAEEKYPDESMEQYFRYDTKLFAKRLEEYAGTKK